MASSFLRVAAFSQIKEALLNLKCLQIKIISIQTLGF